MTLLIKKIVVKLYPMRSVSTKLCAAMQSWFILESLFLSQWVLERVWNFADNFPLTPAKLSPTSSFSLYTTLGFLSFFFFHLYASPQSIRVPHLTPQCCCEAAHCCLGEIAFTHGDFPGMWMKLLRAAVSHHLSVTAQTVIRQSCHVHTWHAQTWAYSGHFCSSLQWEQSERAIVCSKQ